jgi:hypothetical protein
MPYEDFANPFVRQALVEIDTWGASGTGLTMEKLGRLMWRIKQGGADGPQVLFLRPAPGADHLEPYLAEPTDPEIALLKRRFASEPDVVFPYLRGGRGRGALLRVRNLSDLHALREVVLARGKAAASPAH